MAIQFAITEHTYAFPSNVLAKSGGKHIFNMLLTNDQDQGIIVGRGDFVELDLYKETTAPTGVAGVIRMRMANGNYLVEITDAKKGAIFLCNEAMINEEYSSKFKNLKNYYNPKGTVVRGIELADGDRLEYSLKGFDGTPAVGKTLSLNTDGKWKVATDTTGA